MDKYHTIRGICQGTGLLSGYYALGEYAQQMKQIVVQS